MLLHIFKQTSTENSLAENSMAQETPPLTSDACLGDWHLSTLTNVRPQQLFHSHRIQRSQNEWQHACHQRNGFVTFRIHAGVSTEPPCPLHLPPCAASWKAFRERQVP
jgi:hypothetical protein